MTDPAIIAELKRLADDNGGVLTASTIVVAARDEESILHSQFEWDDSAAAEQYRMWQARRLLNVVVEYIGPKDGQRRTRVFVSLTPDRTGKDGGYRQITAVLSDREHRQQLLDDALEEMERFQRKYEELQELVEVISAMRKVCKARVAAD